MAYSRKHFRDCGADLNREGPTGKRRDMASMIRYGCIDWQGWGALVLILSQHTVSDGFSPSHIAHGTITW